MAVKHSRAPFPHADLHDPKSSAISLLSDTLAQASYDNRGLLGPHFIAHAALPHPSPGRTATRGGVGALRGSS